MLVPNKITSNIKPTIFEDLGNGNWYYNYDIQSEEINLDIKDNNFPKILYNYIQIKLPNKPTYQKCVEAIIRQYISQTQEFDLINSYNLSLLNKVENNKDIEKYKEYLSLLDTIKNNCKKDFNLI